MGLRLHSMDENPATLMEMEKQYFSLRAKTSEPDRFLEITDGWVRCAVTTRPKMMWDIYPVSVHRILYDFEKADELASLRAKYNLTSNGLFKLLKRVGADPWEKIIADYEACGNLNAVARRQGLKPTTISKGLKKKGVEIRKGRNPIQVDRQIVEQMLKEGLSINEIAKKLGVSWAQAKKAELKKK